MDPTTNGTPTNKGGGHLALLAATLPVIAASADFYGAGVSSGRPGGGPPSLELVPQIPGRQIRSVNPPPD